MLKKLLGYDFRAVGKTMWLLTVIVALTTALGCVSAVSLWNIDWDAYNTPNLAIVAVAMALVCAIIISFIAVIAYAVMAVIMIIRRYYSNLFTDEGYLTFTLPVKVSTIFNAKVLSGILWTAIVLAVEVLCFGALLLFVISPENVAEAFDFYITYFSGSSFDANIPVWQLALIIAEYVLVFIAGILYELLLIYLCVTVATVIAKKARVILGIGIYFGVNSVVSTLIQVFTMVMSYITSDTMIEIYDTDVMVSAFFTEMLIQQGFYLLIYGGIAVGSYILNRYLLKKKLNLL